MGDILDLRMLAEDAVSSAEQSFFSYMLTTVRRSLAIIAVLPAANAEAVTPAPSAPITAAPAVPPPPPSAAAAAAAAAPAASSEAVSVPTPAAATSEPQQVSGFSPVLLCFSRRLPKSLLQYLP